MFTPPGMRKPTPWLPDIQSAKFCAWIVLHSGRNTIQRNFVNSKAALISELCTRMKKFQPSQSFSFYSRNIGTPGSWVHAYSARSRVAVGNVQDRKIGGATYESCRNKYCQPVRRKGQCLGRHVWRLILRRLELSLCHKTRKMQRKYNNSPQKNIQLFSFSKIIESWPLGVGGGLVASCQKEKSVLLGIKGNLMKHF